MDGVKGIMLKVDDELPRSLALALINLIMLPPDKSEWMIKRIKELIQAISEREQSNEE